MKRFFFIIAAALGLSVAASAQQMPIPVDPAVRIGHLDNGLTYYIRHNEEPKGQANFYIAQKVGSILEEENQRGLAHFLEHMCFNGTRNFPGNRVIQYCESIGVKFGTDINAYTSIDETVYNIDNVPVGTTPSAIDSCLLILHDWADGLLLLDADIDSERGVIHEEWRSRQNAQMRMYETLLPKVYPNNKYGVRMPIGLMEIVDNFPYQALRDYYEKWYRPDQQGIVVVGDLDVDAVEAKIKAIFSDIAKPEGAAERYYVPVEDNEAPIIAIASDPEQPYALSYIFKKHEPVPTEMKGDLNYFIIDYANTMIDLMMAQRLEEMTQVAEPPFIQAQIGDDDFFLSKTKAAFAGIAITDENGVMKGATSVYREMLRAARGGFTASEYERAKADYMTQVESAYNQREKRKSASFCSEYVRHFIDNEPIPGIENEYMLLQQLVPNIPVDVINQVVAQYMEPANLVVMMMLPQKEGVSYPDEAAVAAAFAAVEAEDIAPYEDETSDEPLLAELPQPGKVVKTAEGPFGYKKLTLSNGATVYLKSTDFNADQILMRAFSEGGTSLYSDSEIVNLDVLDEVFTIGGAGNFSATALNKALAGKKVSLNASVSTYQESISGSTTPKDFETLLQLTYLRATAPRVDQEAFVSWQNKTRSLLQNAEAQPMSAFQDSLYKVVYGGNPRARQMKAADVDKVNYARVMQIGAQRFANAADFTFIFTGAIDEATAVPLIEQYIGSLPAKGKKEKRKDVGMSFAQGYHQRVFDKEMETPMTTIAYLMNGRAKYDLKTDLAGTVAGQILTQILLEEIREKEGGTYGITASAGLQDFPKPVSYMQIVYQTDPEKYEYLNSRVEQIISDFVQNGSSDEALNKTKEYLLKTYQENLRENSYHASILREYLETGVDMMTGYEAAVKAVTVKDAQEYVKNILSQNNTSKVVMNGIKK